MDRYDDRCSLEAAVDGWTDIPSRQIHERTDRQTGLFMHRHVHACLSFMCNTFLKCVCGCSRAHASWVRAHRSLINAGAEVQDQIYPKRHVHLSMPSSACARASERAFANWEP